jgi:hypothetical protein
MKPPILQAFVIKCETPREAILHEVMPIVGSLYRVTTLTANQLQNLPGHFSVKVELVPVVADDEAETK